MGRAPTDVMRVFLSVLGLGILGVTACASAGTSYPRAQFVGSCTTKNGPEMAAYCECSWRFARQEVAPQGIDASELASAFEDAHP